jgi:hypothetical protein
MRAPAPERPAAVMQREKEFMEVVFEIRDLIAKLQAPEPVR